MQPKLAGTAIQPRSITVDTRNISTPAETQDKADWAALAKNVKAEFMQAKLLKLEEVNQLIKEYVPPPLRLQKATVFDEIEELLSSGKNFGFCSHE